MDIYEAHTDDVADALTQTIEHATSKKIRTIKILEGKEDEELKALIIFEDKTILDTFFTIQIIEGKIACRVRGNYI